MIKQARNAFILAAAVGAVGASSVAVAEVTANAAVTSNYVWRGLSQTDDGAALQGGVDYAHESGFYLGAWASNFDYGEDADSGIEYDLYAGFANEVGEFGYDVAYLTYNYTDSDLDTAKEIKLGVSYNVASLNYYIGDSGASDMNTYNYIEVGADFELPAESTLVLHYGMASGDYVEASDPEGDKQQTDYSVGISKDFAGFNVGLSYADHSDDDGLFFATVSKEFEF